MIENNETKKTKKKRKRDEKTPKKTVLIGQKEKKDELPTLFEKLSHFC